MVPRGVEDTTADGGAGQLGAAAEDGANKGEGTKSSLSESPCEPLLSRKGVLGRGAESNVKTTVGAKVGKRSRYSDVAAGDDEGGTVLSISRRPMVEVRAEGGRWLRVRDVEFAMFGKLRGPVQKAPTLMSRSLLRQMRWEGWKEETTASLELLVEGHHGASEFKVTIVEEESPMLVLGADVVKWLCGCGMSWEAVAAPEEETCFAVPQFRAGALVMDDEGWSPPGEDVDTQEFEARRWDALVEQHQRAAVEGEEPGNLESGGDCAPQQGVLSDVLTESWRELASVKDCDLPSGPATMTPADNPEKYKDIKDAFEPGLIHKHAEAWAEMDPAPDSEVLHWVRHSEALRSDVEGSRSSNEEEEDEREQDVEQTTATGASRGRDGNNCGGGC